MECSNRTKTHVFNKEAHYASIDERAWAKKISSLEILSLKRSVVGSADCTGAHMTPVCNGPECMRQRRWGGGS